MKHPTFFASIAIQPFWKRIYRPENKHRALFLWPKCSFMFWIKQVYTKTFSHSGIMNWAHICVHPWNHISKTGTCFCGVPCLWNLYLWTQSTISLQPVFVDPGYHVLNSCNCFCGPSIPYHGISVFGIQCIKSHINDFADQVYYVLKSASVDPVYHITDTCFAYPVCSTIEMGFLLLSTKCILSLCTWFRDQVYYLPVTCFSS